MKVIEWNSFKLFSTTPRAYIIVSDILSEALKKFLEYIDLISRKDFANFYYMVAFRSGMRIGELSALEWSDIDEKSCTVTISKSYS